MIFNTRFETKKHHLISVFLLLLILLLLSSCASNPAIVLFNEQPENKNTQNNIATLFVPIEIDLVYVDGKRKAFYPAYQQYVPFKLLAGERVYGFRYQDMQLNGDGNLESVTSETVIIRFTAAAGDKYVIDFTPPATLTEALTLEKSFTLTLSQFDDNINASKRTIIAHSFPAPEAPVADWLGAKPFTADIENLFNDEMLANDNTKPAENAPVQAHLRHWWEKASQQEQTEFKRWVKNNP